MKMDIRYYFCVFFLCFSKSVGLVWLVKIKSIRAQCVERTEGIKNNSLKTRRNHLATKFTRRADRWWWNCEVMREVCCSNDSI